MYEPERLRSGAYIVGKSQAGLCYGKCILYALLLSEILMFSKVLTSVAEICVVIVRTYRCYVRKPASIYIDNGMINCFIKFVFL